MQLNIEDEEKRNEILQKNDEYSQLIIKEPNNLVDNKNSKKLNKIKFCKF